MAQAPLPPSGDYVLGTTRLEIDRLAIQHRIWRARVLHFWRRAGLYAGQTALDVGCGPGWASLDLAELVGARGRVIAIDRSPNFIAHARARAEAEGLSWIDLREADVTSDWRLDTQVDFAWCRWLLCFLPDPAAAIRSVAAALKPGGVFAIQEYVDYCAWTLIPPDPAFSRFVEAVRTSWLADGGDPDIALRLPPMLEEAGFEVIGYDTIADATHPRDLLWAWPLSFARTAPERLIELKHFTDAEAAALEAALDAAEAGGRRMLTPVTAQITARKR